MKHLTVKLLALCALIVAFCILAEHSLAENETLVADEVKEIYSRFQNDERNSELIFSPAFITSDNMYRLSFYEKSDPNFESRIDCVIFDNMTVQRGFSMTFFSNYNYSYLQNRIQALVASIDPHLSTSDVDAIAERLISTFAYSKDSEFLPDRPGFSDIVTVGEYKVFIESTNGLGHITMVNARHVNDVNVPSDIDEYEKLTFSQIRSGFNAFWRSLFNTKQKICVTGTVEDQYTNTDNVWPWQVVIFSSDGNRYKAEYSLSRIATFFEIGQEYTFYGAISPDQEDEYACMALYFYLESEN